MTTAILSQPATPPMTGNGALTDTLLPLYPTITLYLRRQWHLQTDDAQDLTQDTFEHAINAAHNGHFRPHHTKAWLLQIARRLATDYYRHRQVEFATCPPAHALTTDNGTPKAHHLPDPDDDCDPLLCTLRREHQREASATTTTILAALKPIYRQALLLQTTHHFSYQEIARHQHITLAATKTRVMRAKQKARAIALACSPAPPTP